MQKEFRLSDQIYRALFEQTHDGVFIIDLTLKIVAVNPQGANMLGYEVAELIGKSVNDVVALEERLEQDNSNAFPDAGQGPFYERIYRRKDGSTFPVEISMSFVFSAGQAKPYIQSIVRDITERKRWEERLRDSEARNRAIVEAFPDLVIRLQEDGQILEISAGENHPLYFKNENVIGKTMPEIWPRLDDKELRSSLQSLKQSNAPQVFEAIFSEAGNTYEVRLSSIGGGEVLALVRDISDRARLERMKTDFINRASHELRTPVTTAKLMAELIQEDFAEIGVTVEIVSYEWGEYLSRSRALDRDGAILLGWTGDNGDPDNFLAVLLGCDAVGGSNRAQWCYKPFEDLIQKAKTVSDPGMRTQLYEQAQVVFKEQAPWATIAHSVVFMPMRPEVEGYVVHPLGGHIFDEVSLR